jgi:hypothetical protein
MLPPLLLKVKTMTTEPNPQAPREIGIPLYSRFPLNGHSVSRLTWTTPAKTKLPKATSA